ncbi:MAG: lasso peptide biosynthesis B2 protein [Thermoleophilia bacterium]|nr:lasso peptide biosynthesis B2 protein [Thermoleophilia bacterium]
MNPLRAAKRLKDPRDLWLFTQILIMLVLLPRLISRSSMPDLLARIDPGAAEGNVREVAPGDVPGAPADLLSGGRDLRLMQKTVGFTDTLIKYRIFQRYGKCLLRSLILFRFLRRQGWPVEIHFGVRKTAEGLADITGHSWLVLEGEPFLENDQIGGYVTTYSYPAERSA